MAYRVFTLLASLGSAILSACSLAFLVTALISFRADDFLFASKTEDFTTLGTCVETFTEPQISHFNYREQKCDEDPESEFRRNVRNSLSVSAHGILYAYYQSELELITSVDGGSEFHEVVASVLTHIAGPTKDPTTGLVTMVNVPAGINYTTAVDVLKRVSALKVPVSCDELYGLKFADAIDDGDLYKDSAMEQYIDDIREGRLNEDGEIKSTWPLADIVIDCDDESTSLGSGDLQEIQAPTPAGYLALPALTRQKVHAHCTAQFQFASVGTNADGTWGIPLPGIQPGPYYRALAWEVEGFNETASYNMRTRMYLGWRFGWSLFAYVPMFLCTCFLLADSVVFFLAEAVMPITLDDQKQFTRSVLSQARDSLVMQATSKMSRRARFSIGLLSVLASWTLFAFFIGGPWGLVDKNLARPQCEADALGFGKAPDHWVNQIAWKGTTGGWKADYDATWYDLATLATQMFVLLLLPFTTWPIFKDVNALVNTQGGAGGRTTVSEVTALAQNVTAKKGYQFHHKVLMFVLGAAVLIILVGQSISGARFGVAWAQGVVALEWNTDKSGWMFDEMQIGEVVYDQTIATVALAVATGLVFSTALQRHLINGVGCYSASLFFGWVALICVFALPITIFAANRSIFNEKSSTKDCNLIFPRDSHEGSNDVCVSRFWTLLVGGGLFVATILLITALGAYEAVQNLLTARESAQVSLKQNTTEDRGIFGKGTPFVSAAGYRSESEPFFNYQGSLPMLPVPRMHMPGL